MSSINYKYKWFLDEGTHYGNVAHMCFRVWLILDKLYFFSQKLYKLLHGDKIQEAIEKKYP